MADPGRGDPREHAERLAAHGQEHVLRFADELDERGRARLARQLARLDLDRVQRMIDEVLAHEPADAASLRLEPIPLVELGDGAEHEAARREALEAGQEALASGRLATLLVAGGQGTRLGFEGPKGCFPIGPVTDRPLFAYHAQRVLATSRRYGVAVPLYVMTSEANHEATTAFFEEHDRFGLHPDQVRFFTQGMLPAVDREGRMLLSARDSLALSPDGHGGCFGALAAHGILDEMRERGIDQLFYLQVDNPLAPVLDPVFIGHHLLDDAEMSTKVVAKIDPTEKVGVLGLIDGRPGVIEYSDLDEELAASRDEQGRLRFRAGNIAIHVIARPLVERIARGGVELPVHRAEKKVPHVAPSGELVRPDAPNAIKMEMFVFDALPHARGVVTQEVERREEFAPVKNAEGSDSPHTAARALVEQGRRWLEHAGRPVEHDVVEVGPLFALDADEFRRNLTDADRGPVYDLPPEGA